MQGTDVVASMVVFTNGVSDKAEYRKFKTKLDHNNDFYNMHETLKRRLSERNRKAWGIPSLVLIDGGKGQLDAAFKPAMNKVATPFPSSAWPNVKNRLSFIRLNLVVTLNEQILHQLGGFVTESDDFLLVNIPHNTNLVKLLQRIRDESHRFAVSYHSVLKVKRQTASLLDDIPGIGPTTRKKLLRSFGSLRAVSQASPAELDQAIGHQKAQLVYQFLNADISLQQKV